MLTLALYLLCVFAVWLLASVVIELQLCLFLKACADAEADDDTPHDQSDRLETINATDTHEGCNAA